MIRVVRRHELRNTAALDELAGSKAGPAAPPPPEGPLFELRGVERRYSKGSVTVRAVRGVDLDIEAGGLVSLEGPSGSGKSTLLLMLGALEVPTAGTIRFAGRDLTSATDRVLTEIRSKEIGFVFQQFNLIPTLSALDNVEIAMIPRHVGHEDRRHRAAELLDQVGLADRRRPSPLASLGRRAAAGGDRPRPRQRAAGDHRRRADGQPRLGERRRGDVGARRSPVRRAA